MPSLFDWISQPLLLSLVQTFTPLGQFIPSYGETLGGTIPSGLQEGYSGNRDTMSANAKAALAAILGTAGIAAVGLGVAADRLTNTRITIREEVDGRGHTALEFLKDRKVESVLALLALGGLLFGTQLLPKGEGSAPQLPFFVGGGGGGAVATPSAPAGGDGGTAFPGSGGGATYKL